MTTGDSCWRRTWHMTAASPVIAQAETWAKLHAGWTAREAIFEMTKGGAMPEITKQMQADAYTLMDSRMRNYDRTRWLQQHREVLRFHGALTSSAYEQA